MMEDNEKGNPQLCSLYPPTMQGNGLIDMSSNMEWTDIEQHVKHVQIGGIYSPSDCTPRQHLAIIIPFRNREYQLKMLLRHLHPFLQRQKRSYRIFVVEQFGNGTFNKGLIMNVAFNHASKISAPVFNCFMFHDVDLIPENDYNVYECDQHGPRHLAPAVDELRYFLMYNDLIGGVLAVTKDQFMKANGWSNLYWGWGFEDDDMNHRLRHAGYRVSRPPNSIGRYKMIRHEKQVPASNRLPLGYQQENDSSMSIVVVKFLVSSLLLFGYTCQLCLTTVCTPSIYLNWFLVVTDCRYTYTYLLSSYTFAGGVLISLSWTVISFLHLVVHRFRI
ncbi:unnamed protein product [Rotaria sp. Silwood1]|nr:unnamed protein product [Rotaria sp. Silwood1]CAF3355474.1 unnamed protein product [Rotaria sp. Silwood1]CAF3421115.1 unnamed protein product [Rotaria sp. Silwood1]